VQAEQLQEEMDADGDGRVSMLEFSVAAKRESGGPVSTTGFGFGL
jgi:hypothetical protein